MIGPHEGQELELMLAGKKRLAAYNDIIPENGKIAEAIIPEKKFKPYVDSGELIRFCEDYVSPDNHHIRIVCFTVPAEEWRAKAYIFIRKKLQMREIQYTNSYDEFIGLLLDYNPSDIQHFLNHDLQFNRT
tara:strand:- start:1496 stop:1888 length:393 start_codon:yes stop_codon:yes gene_type:complete